VSVAEARGLFERLQDVPMGGGQSLLVQEARELVMGLSRVWWA
jgi:hypothetical protein